jgi:hypothetical protein
VSFVVFAHLYRSLFIITLNSLFVLSLQPTHQCHHPCVPKREVLSLQRMLSSSLALVCLAYWRLGMPSAVHAFQLGTAVSPKHHTHSFATTTTYRTPARSSSAIGMSSVSVDYRATYNFGPASSRDTIVYSAERPGNDPDSKTTRVNNEQVMDWST